MLERNGGGTYGHVEEDGGRGEEGHQSGKEERWLVLDGRELVDEGLVDEVGIDDL